MKNFTYLKKTVVLVLWIPMVLLIFRFIADRQLAAVFAGVGFILVPSAVLIHEIFAIKDKSTVIIIMCFQFLTLFAVPILSLRLLNWGTPFNEILFLGVFPAKLHQFSSWSYFLMVAAVATVSFTTRRNKKRQP